MLCQRLVVRPVITDPVTVTLPITTSNQVARNPHYFVVPVTVTIGCPQREDAGDSVVSQ